MNIRDIREIMGLTQAQVADELGVPRQEVIDCEENGETYLLLQYISAFPINPGILKDPDVDPFLPSFDQTSPGERLRAWREEHGLSPEEAAAALEISPLALLEFESGVGNQISRRRGEEFERRLGINRKWLMYGDGRVKGSPRLSSSASSPRRERSPKEARVPAPNREAGARVREARQAAGLSREELADLLELSVSRVAQMESGYIRDQKADHILSRIAAASGNSSAPETPREAGLRLREFRKSVGLSVKEAAGLLGLKHTTLAHLESGYISGKHADELIEKLQVSAAEAGSRAFDPKKAGAQIRQERIRAGLSQKELGTILRLPLPRISLIELGNVTEPEAKNILRRIHGKPVREIKTRKVRQSDQVLLGSNIRDAREAAGLSQKALGNMLQLPQTRVSLIERGKVDEATGKKILQMLTALSENQDERKAIPDPVLTAARPARARKSRNPELGRKIQEARQAAGLSQKALASMLGLSQGSISYMEQGRVDEETAERVLTLIARPTAD